MAFNGFLVGIVLGLVKVILRKLFRSGGGPQPPTPPSPRIPTAMFCWGLAGISLTLMTRLLYGDDGGLPEIMSGAPLVPNVAILVGTSISAGAGLTAGVGVVTVIVNSVTTSVSAPDASGTTGGQAGGGAASGDAPGGVSSGTGAAATDPSQIPGGVFGQPDPGSADPAKQDEQEEEDPPNYTLDIRTEGGSTTIKADDEDQLRITATVLCDKPDVDTSGAASTISFEAMGPAGDWLDLGGRSMEGATAAIVVKASPPTPQSTLENDQAEILVSLALGQGTYTGTVHLTVEPADYHLEVEYDDE